MFIMRFDMRAPSFGAPVADLYQASLEMVAFAETRGCLAAVVCEHHVSDDGYLPAPVTLATAMAACTTSLMISNAIIQLPLYDPIRLAEQMVVVDNLSRGRVSYVAGLGYRPEEYALFGVDFARRGAIADSHLALLLQAKTGEPFEHEGRTKQVLPAPFTPGGPAVMWGGGSAPAARRAGRFGLGFLAQGGGPELTGIYEEAARAAGHEPGFCFVPPLDTATVVFVAEDVDAAWAELGPHLMHDVLSYAAWNQGDDHTASLSVAQTADELRAEDRTHRIVTVGQAVDLIRAGSPLNLHPLIGGLPPEVAWRYLRTVTDVVMPALTA